MSFAGNYLKSIYVRRNPETNKAIHILSSAFKATMTWHNLRTLQECRKACGGQGLKTENLVGQLISEYDAQSTFEGDNNVLMQQISKALLAEYLAAQKKKTPFKGLWLEHMNGLAPVIPSCLTSSHLRSSQIQTDVFYFRERDLLNRFAAEVSQHLKLRKSREQALLVSHQLAEELGRAFADKTIFLAFKEAEEKVTAGSLKNILSLIRSLYALVILDEDAAFLRYGYLSAENAAAVRQGVSKLCTELRPHALALVSSFGIPDVFLGPIAFDWIAANAWFEEEETMATFELYRRSTIGLCLTETLDELVSNGTLSPEIAIQVLVQFDKSMTDALETQVKSKVTLKGHLHTYRFCDNVWTFILQDALFKNEESQENIGGVKIVACDSKLLIQ
ncbi:hypothetical protein Droror1_Dr00003984 [Drosera rotundifolia]